MNLRLDLYCNRKSVFTDFLIGVKIRKRTPKRVLCRKINRIQEIYVVITDFYMDAVI